MLVDLEALPRVKPGVREDEFYALGEDSDWESGWEARHVP